MSDQESEYRRELAMQKFNKAHRKAILDHMKARVTGQNLDLLPFDKIRHHLLEQNIRYRGIQTIPLDNIVGSVGRYNELDRKFLPLTETMRERWVNVSTVALDRGWPPIDVYKIGDVYFVYDGNHRVSAARAMGMESIEAQVCEYTDDVKICPEDELIRILIRLDEHKFLETTGIAKRYPDYDVRFTTPNGYPELTAQIQEMKGILAQIDESEPDYEQAVDAWYELTYLPTVQIIRNSTLLEDFPGRTEADLFVWMSRKRGQLREIYGDFDNLAQLAALLANQYKEKGVDKLRRRLKNLFGSDALPPLDNTEDSSSS